MIIPIWSSKATRIKENEEFLVAAFRCNDINTNNTLTFSFVCLVISLDWTRCQSLQWVTQIFIFSSPVFHGEVQNNHQWQRTHELNQLHTQRISLLFIVLSKTKHISQVRNYRNDPWKYSLSLNAGENWRCFTGRSFSLRVPLCCLKTPPVGFKKEFHYRISETEISVNSKFARTWRKRITWQLLIIKVSVF